MPSSVFSVPWIIESADYTGDVKDQIMRMEARYVIQVTKGGWSEIPLAIPGAAITAVKIEKKAGEAYIVPRNGAYALVVSKKGTYRVLIQFSQLVSQDSQFEGISVGIPAATFSTVSLFVPRKDVELRPADQLYVDHQTDAQRGGVKLTARVGASDRIDLRWRTKPAAPVKVEPVLYGEVQSLISIEEQLARLTTIVDYRAAQGEVRQLRVDLPAAANVLNVRGAGIEDWHVVESANKKELWVSLGFALKDAAYRLVVESEQTLEGNSASYALPEIQLIGVKQERGYVAVARAGSIELSPVNAEGIHRVDIKELPEPMRASLGSATVLAFKYHQHPFQATLNVVRHEDHPVLAAIAERGELSTVVSAQGELLTRAVYLIKANKKQFLEAQLPDKAQLWSCLVDGRSVKPVKGSGEKLLIPLDAVSDATWAIRVELVYFEQRPVFSRLGRLGLQGPVLDVPTTIANWSVYVPQAMRFLQVKGNLEQGAAAADFLDEPPVSRNMASASGDYEANAREAFKRKDSGFIGGMQQSVAALKRRLTGNAKTATLESTDQIISQYEPYYGASPASDNPRGDEDNKHFGKPVNGNRSKEELVSGADLSRLETTGILPLEIRLPKTGSAYHFNRLMTTDEPLKIDATFVRVPMSWVLLFGCALMLIPAGAFAAGLIRRRT